MLKRRKIINKKFQFKTTFKIIGIIIIAFILIIAITGIISSDNNKKINSTIIDLNRAIEKENNIIATLMEYTDKNHDKKKLPDKEIIKKDHTATMEVIKSHILSLNKIAIHNRILITLMIAVGILLGIILYFYLIILTHRISGPIFVLTSHVRDIIDGREPDLRELRKNDEFKDFYNQFIEMVNKIKKTKNHAE